MAVQFVVLNKVSKDYLAGELTVRALSNIELSISIGEFVVILGPSGCGKTTLLNILGGIDTATTGIIKVNAKTVTDMDEKSLTDYRKTEIGFIFQFYNLIPTLTAVENVEVAARLVFAPKEAYSRSMEILKQVELEDKASKFPSQLSGGEQQRVAIARALVKNPKIVLADEPTGNLDSITGEKIIALMQKICKEQHTTFLVVTHNVSISKIADRVIYLKDGKLFGTSKPEII
ncbi:MAG: ABC transporter ATP-binding protein [Candidatus Odinarchaeota archaeon]